MIARGLLAGVVATLLIAAPAAAEKHVTTAGNEGNGSLREAIANALPGELIVIDPGVNPVLSSQIIIERGVTIRGQGIGASMIGAAGATRMFELAPGVTGVRIEDMTIGGGRAPNGPGGASEIPGPTQAEDGGVGANGGAILVLNNAELTVERIAFNGNEAGMGGTGGNGSALPAGDGGEGGSGGAIYSLGSLTVIDSTFSGNESGRGGSGGLGSGAIPSNPGYGGNGGAIASEGDLTVVDSTFWSNAAADGQLPSASGLAVGPAGEGAYGGAIFATNGSVIVERSTFASNEAGDGADGGSSLVGGDGGLAGAGGAIYTLADHNEITNTTFVDNRAGDGGDGGASSALTGGDGGPGGSAGAITAPGLTPMTVSASTFVGNAAGVGGQGGSGDPADGASGEDGHGGAVGGLPSVHLRGSLLAENSAAPGSESCGKVLVEPGNLVWPVAGGCSGVTVADPKLAPGGLAANGGLTETVAIGLGSTAIDLVPAGACTAAGGASLAVDQRGAPRPFGAGCDAGAFEMQESAPPPPPAIAAPSAPDTRLTKRPKKTVRLKGKKKKAKVSLSFASTPAGAAFQCKLDRGKYAVCKSPKTYKLKPGKHTISVRAVLGGAVDPTPATVAVKVVKDRPKPGRR